MSSSNDQLAIITVVYKNYLVLEDFFKSLQRQSNKKFHLYISDLSEEIERIDTKSIKSTILFGENKGYSHGINLGLQKAIKQNFNQFCIINNDTYFEANFVESVRASLEKHKNSIIGSKILYAKGYEYHKNSYSDDDLGRVIWYAGGGIDWDNALTPHRGVDEVDRNQYNRTESTDFITGTFMAFDRAVVQKVGFWDESYFLYFEDADWCERAKRKNIKLIYDPSIVIFHKVSQSTGGSGSSLHQKYQSRNRLKFALKYAPLKTKLHLAKNRLISFLRGRD